MKTSKIATIVYRNYEENVDMLNSAFKQSELDALVKSDSDIIRVDYYINGELVGNKMYTAKQAIAQVLKMTITSGNLYGELLPEGGYDWVRKGQHNERVNAKIYELQSKMDFYSKFIDEESFENSELPCALCCSWEDYKN